MTTQRITATREQFERAILASGLPQGQKNLLLDRFRGRSVAEIAANNGIDREVVRRIEIHALATVRDVLATFA